MPDSRGRTPRSSAPKTLEERFEAFERELTSIKNRLADFVSESAKKDQVDAVVKSLAKMNEDVKILLARKGTLTSVWYWFWTERNWSILTAVALLSGITWCVRLGLGILIDQRTNQMGANIVKISERVAKLEGRFAIENARTLVDRIGHLPVSELPKHTVELNQSRSLLAQTDAKSRTENFWPLAYRAITITSEAEFRGSPPEHHDEASSVTIPDYKANIYDHVSHIRVSKQTVTLKGLIADSTFSDCIVKFDPSVSLVNVQFVHCVFMFEDLEQPSKPLQEVASLLLGATTLDQVRLTTSAKGS